MATQGANEIPKITDTSIATGSSLSTKHNVLILTVILMCFGVWCVDADLGAYASVVGLCSAMFLLSLALENATAILSVKLRQLECHISANMMHSAVFIPKILLTTLMWHRFREAIMRHAIVGSTIVPLLVFIPILYLRVAYYDRNDHNFTPILEGLNGDLLEKLCTSRLVDCAFLALVAPYFVTGTGPKTVVFYAINMVLSLELASIIGSAFQRKAGSHRNALHPPRLYVASFVMLAGLLLLISATVWLLDQRLVQTIEHHRQTQTRFPSKVIGTLLLPLMTDAAGIYRILHGVRSREDAVQSIVHCIGTARTNLVFGALCASFSSLVFGQQFLMNGAFVFSLLSFLFIATGVSFLQGEEGTPMNTGVAFILLLVGYLIVALTMA